MKAAFEPPKLSFWPFLAADVALLAVAYWIGNASGGDPSPSAIWSVVVCVALGGLLVCIPLIVNYNRKLDLALAERQREIAALAETTASSSEQISIAVGGLNQLVDSLHKATRHAEHLPLRLQERVNELKAQINEVAVEENEALAQELNTLRASETERLEAVVDRIQKLAAEFAALESASRHAWTTLAEQLKATQEERVAQLQRERDEWEARVSELEARSPVVTSIPLAPTVAPFVVEKEPERPSIPSVPVSSEPPPAPEEPAPALPAGEIPTTPEPTVQTPPPPAIEAVPALTASSMPFEVKTLARRESRRSSHDLLQGDLGLDLPESDVDFEGVSSSSLSADGATRVIATAYIGIGNKLFVRGEGPGLRPDKGVPLQFVSIGKWRWESEEVTAPITLSFWKNDEERSSNIASVTVDPSHQQEVKLTF